MNSANTIYCTVLAICFLVSAITEVEALCGVTRGTLYRPTLIVPNVTCNSSPVQIVQSASISTIVWDNGQNSTVNFTIIYHIGDFGITVDIRSGEVIDGQFSPNSIYFPYVQIPNGDVLGCIDSNGEGSLSGFGFVVINNPLYLTCLANTTLTYSTIIDTTPQPIAITFTASLSVFLCL